MRFVSNGPSIPDSLLQARDEGRVVFFCGAGVSRARAKLPDFFGLAEDVIRRLGSPHDSDACRFLKVAKEVGNGFDIPGLVSADKVFSLLELEFTPKDIQAAVAGCLKPPSDVDRSAHDILLRLAKTPDGKTQLVTTNFDRLFESDANPLCTFQSPRLPRISRHDDLNGIVYLHGRVDAQYGGSDEDGFILSLSDFGHAYLAEGWATEFLREIVRGFVVVFVGYSADDPPVQYLLEGLRRTAGSRNPIYAFQSDGSSQLVTRWEQKGVIAIPYTPIAGGHGALWDTLERWADRADDASKWQQSVLDRAMEGPEQLLPHERGQVAHIVSTREGAIAFTKAKPPAEWLCVFDPLCRYERPGRTDRTSMESPIRDPFALYGLDFDVIPQRSDETFSSGSQEILDEAWDAFKVNDADQQELSPGNLATVRGHCSSHLPPLPGRLYSLGTWIARVSTQPAAVWWAARQKSIHPHYRQCIESEVTRLGPIVDCILKEAWTYVLEAWNTSITDPRYEWYDLKNEITRDGWSSRIRRRFITLFKPHLQVTPAFLPRPTPPKVDEFTRLGEVVRIEVECPVPSHDADIPDEWLPQVIFGLRNNIQEAVHLCNEVGAEHELRICPIVRDTRPDISDFQRTRGLSGCVIRFAGLFERLVDRDLKRAKEEFEAWPSNDDPVFSRLRCWASGKREVASPRTFAAVVRELSDEVFWGSHHQRDILLSLKSRWNEISRSDRRRIENRLRRGPKRWKGEKRASHRERRAFKLLQRLQWLSDGGCVFSFDVVTAIATLRTDAPNWRSEYAVHAADSMEMQSGFVATDTEYSLLMSEPIESLVSKALELSGRSETNYLKEHDPFGGLCITRPKRAYLALVHASEQIDVVLWGWKKFLDSSARSEDSPSFSAIVARRLNKLPDETLLKLLGAATSWLQKVSKSLSKFFPAVFEAIIERFFDVLQREPGSNALVERETTRRDDWFTAAINSPVGHIVRAILDDVPIDSSHAASSKRWLQTVEKYLTLSGDQRRHAIALTSHHLGWLYRVDRNWTDRHLLSILDADVVDDHDALWAGFLWNPQVNAELYRRIKPSLLNVIKERSLHREGQTQSLAYLAVQGWIIVDEENIGPWITDVEFRDAILQGGDEFRSHVLWQFERLLSRAEADDHAELLAKARDFFHHVWPHQKSLKNSKMTARLCDVLLSHRDSFAALMDVIPQHLTTLDRQAESHIRLWGSEVRDVVKAYPEQFLRVLCAVLPENVQSWPYGTGEAIETIVESDSSLATDSRVVDLRRKWNAK